MPILTETDFTKDPAWRLLNYKHQVKVPRYCTINPEFESAFGVTVYEEGNPNETIYQFVTVDRLMDFYENGAVPRFVEHSRARMVVDDVAELIAQWRVAIQQGVDVVDPPMEYLGRLEEFAAKVFPQARISRAIDIREATVSVTALESYLAQRRKFKEPSHDTRIDALPTEAPSVLDLLVRAERARFGE